MKTDRFHVHVAQDGKPSPDMHLQCIRCDKILSADYGTNYADFPSVNDGVVFRSSGQYGSAVLDQMVPPGWHSGVQIILCDECMVSQGHRIDAGKTAGS